MRVTVEASAVSPPASSNSPCSHCMKAWLSTIPVVGLSSTPASHRTSGSRRLASSGERKRMGMSMLLAKSWTFCSASICSGVCATIHLPQFMWGIELRWQASYIICLP